MKKYLLLFCLMMAISSTLAQKTYVKVENNSHSTALKGNVPADMKSLYSDSEVEFMDVVNMLAERGYEVEMTMGSLNSSVLMSKRSSSGYNGVREVKLNGDEEVTEVARYNLQGLPVKEYDKGVQIIVYSNYTTKTVIVQ